MPLDVSAQDLAVPGDEVGRVQDLLGRLSLVMELEDRAGDDVDVEFFSQGLVSLEILCPFPALRDEIGLVRDPVQQVVLGQDGELRALGRGLSNVSAGAAMVGVLLHRLR